MCARHHADGVAVGRRLRDNRSAECATGATAVVDKDLLPQILGHFWGDYSGNDVRVTAGRERHHEADGARRPCALSARHRCHRRERCHGRAATVPTVMPRGVARQPGALVAESALATKRY